jgi:hypothetical protein
VWVRKRPIHDEEIASGEFDVVTCVGSTVVVHDARMHSDMQRQIMRHHEFTYDGTFDELTGNEEVFDTAVAGLIPLACDGRVATAMAYGQTGSGKTYTMSSIYARAAAALFRELDERGGADGDDAEVGVSVSFLEVGNSTCVDLFGEGRAVRLVDGIAVGAVEMDVADAEELMAFVQFGLRVRRTEETGVHAASSRSHSILQAHVRRHTRRAGGGKGAVDDRSGRRVSGGRSAASRCADVASDGCLVLVDLAGSEQSIDSMYHDAQRQKEGAAINASLSGALRLAFNTPPHHTTPSHYASPPRAPAHVRVYLYRHASVVLSHSALA